MGTTTRVVDSVVRAPLIDGAHPSLAPSGGPPDKAGEWWTITRSVRQAEARNSPIDVPETHPERTGARARSDDVDRTLSHTLRAGCAPIGQILDAAACIGSAG